MPRKRQRHCNQGIKLPLRKQLSCFLFCRKIPETSIIREVDFFPESIVQPGRQTGKNSRFLSCNPYPAPTVFTSKPIVKYLLQRVKTGAMHMNAVHDSLVGTIAPPGADNVYLVPLRRPMLCERRPAVCAWMDEGMVPGCDD